MLHVDKKNSLVEYFHLERFCSVYGFVYDSRELNGLRLTWLISSIFVKISLSNVILVTV